MQTYRSREFFALFSAVMLPMFLGAVDQTLLATATPTIAHEFGNLGDTSWIAIGYLLTAAISAPIHGRMGDRFGRRNAMLAVLAIFALGSLAGSMARSLEALIASRVLQGLGGGGLMVLSQALIGELVKPADRPRYQGWFAMIFTASSVGGPVLGGLVVHHLGWRWLFWGNLPLCALAAWRMWRLPARHHAGAGSMPADPVGLVLFVITATSLLSWFSLAGHRFHWLSVTSAALLATGTVVGWLLWRQQSRRVAPFLPLELLRRPGVPTICATVVCFAASLFALVFLLPIYLLGALGADPATAGWLMLPLTFGVVAGSTMNSRVTLRLGTPSATPRFGLTATASALGLLALLPPSMAGTAVCMGIAGVGLGTVMPNAQLSMQVLAGRERLGVAAALVALTRSCGASLGTALFGGLAFALLKTDLRDRAAAGIDLAALSPPQIDHALRIAFGAVAAMAALGAWLATRLPRVDLRTAQWNKETEDVQ